MANSDKKPELDEIDRLLEKWGQQLPEPPAQTVKNTLDSLRATAKPATRFNWLRLGVLGGMAAACVLVVAGLLVLINLAGKPAPTPVQVAAAPTVTPTAVSTTVPSGDTKTVTAMSPVVAQAEATATPAPTDTILPLPPTPTAIAPTETATAEVAAPQPPANVSAPQTTLLPPTVQISPVQVPPRSTEIIKPNPPIPAKSPTSGLPVAPQPPAVPATPTAVPAQPIPPTPLPETVTTLSGQVAAVDGGGFTLSNSQQRINFGPNTRLLSNGVAVALSNLKTGQVVTVQARRNAQGELTAETITLTSKVIGPPGNPPKPPSE
jgi:hypothetical protein